MFSTLTLIYLKGAIIVTQCYVNGQILRITQQELQ
nr:MAG TPA: hypothetical protein [Caudoviricetes sp.]